MNEPIKVGDLVQVVRWPCCNTYIGRISVVQGLRGPKKLVCSCGWEGGLEPIATFPSPFIGAPLSCLKRIPPLDELEGQRTEDALRDKWPATDFPTFKEIA